MVASRQVEISFYRGVGRQCGPGFGAISQVFGRTAFPFLRKYIVPAARRVGTDLLEFAVPEVAEVVSGRKKFNTTAKGAGRQSLGKQSGSGSSKKNCEQSHSNKICKTNQSVANRHFYKYLSLIMSIKIGTNLL